MEGKHSHRYRTQGRVVITGPESTGKTDLSMHLASAFSGKFVPEYAREYISHLDGKYTYNDVLHIAFEQVKQQENLNEWRDGIVFFDTWLIITKIWFIEVYGHYPQWLDEKLASIHIDLFLLCAPDIPWEADSVRENGGEKRWDLFHQYENEIIKLGAKYKIIEGTGASRLRLAEHFVNEYFKLL